MLGTNSNVYTASSSTDTNSIKLCKDITKAASGDPVASDGTGGNPDACTYTDSSQLAYVLVY